MLYINPFELLEIESTDKRDIKKAKNRKLAEIELSDEGGIYYNNQLIDRSTLLRIADQLSDDQLAFHWLFIHHQPLLNKFLKTGDTDFYKKYQHHEMFENLPFIHFIEPYFIPAFKNALWLAYHSQNTELVKRLFQAPPMVSIRQRSKLFDQLEKTLIKVYQEKSHTLNWLGVSNQRIQQKGASHLHQKALEKLNLPGLNALPEAFLEIRNHFARMLKEFALLIINHCQSENWEYALELIDLAMELNVSASVGKEVIRARNKIYVKAQKSLLSKEEKLKKAMLQMVQQLQDKKFNLSFYRLSPLEASDGIEAILDDEALKSTVSGIEALKGQVVTVLCEIAVMAWLKNGNNYLFQLIIEKAKRIDLSSSYNKSPDSSAEEDLDLLLLVLIGLRSALSDSTLTKNDKKERASGAVALLRFVLSPELIQELVKMNNPALRAQIFEELYPVFHFAKRYSPQTLIELFRSLNPLANVDKGFKDMLDKIQTYSYQKLKKEADEREKERKTRRKQASQKRREPSFWEKWINNLVKWLRESSNTGNNRIIQFSVVGIMATLIIFLGLVIVPKLNATYDLDKVSAYSGRKPVIIDTTAKVEPLKEYFEEKSKYEGNRLNTNEQPFSVCFGKGKFDASTRNQITVLNKADRDVIVCVFGKEAIIRHAYIRSGDRITLDQLPGGELSLRYYSGKDWNPTKPNGCNNWGGFDTDSRYWYRRVLKQGWLEFTGNTYEYSVFAPGTEAFEKAFIGASSTTYFFNNNDRYNTFIDN